MPGQPERRKTSDEELRQHRQEIEREWNAVHDAPLKLIPKGDRRLHPRISPPDIAKRAYELFQLRGGEHGHDGEDWFTAERELSKGYRGS